MRLIPTKSHDIFEELTDERTNDSTVDMTRQFIPTSPHNEERYSLCSFNTHKND